MGIGFSASWIGIGKMSKNHYNYMSKNGHKGNKFYGVWIIEERDGHFSYHKFNPNDGFTVN